MSTPTQYGYPVKRPGIITAASWQGSDANLSLELTYTNEFGLPQIFVLRCSSVAQGVGLICLPSSVTISDINRDALVASIRMATFIGGTIPGSFEWMTAMTTGQDTMNFQVALGTAKVKAVRLIDDARIEIDMIKSGNNTPVQTIQTDHQEIGTYTFTPDSQLHCVAGAIEKQFPSYVHDPANGVILSQAHRDDIAAYVVTLAMWV